jgi:hypothetical protein
MAREKDTSILDAYGVSSEEETKQITENAAKIHALNEMMKQDGADKKALRAQVHELIHENEQLLGLPWYEQTHYNVLAKLAAWLGRRVMYVFSPSYRAAVQFGLHNAMQDKIPDAPMTEIKQKPEKAEPKKTIKKAPKEKAQEQTIDPSMFVPFDTPGTKDQKTNEMPEFDGNVKYNTNSPDIDMAEQQDMAIQKSRREKLEKAMPEAEKKLYGELRPDRPKEEKDRIFAEAMLMSNYQFADLTEATPTIVEYLIMKEAEKLQAQNRAGEGKEDKYAVHDAFINVLKKHEYILNTLLSNRDQEAMQNLVKEITAPLQDKKNTKELDPLLYTIGEATAVKPAALQDLSYDILNYQGYLMNMTKDQEKAFIKGFRQEMQYKAKAFVKSEVKKMPEEERAALTTDAIKKMEQQQVITMEAQMDHLFKEANMPLLPSLEKELSHAVEKEAPVQSSDIPENNTPKKEDPAKETPKQPERDNTDPAVWQNGNTTQENTYEEEYEYGDNGVPFDYHDPAEYEQYDNAYDEYEADMADTHAMYDTAKEQQQQTQPQSMMASFDTEVAQTIREFLKQSPDEHSHTEVSQHVTTEERDG